MATQIEVANHLDLSDRHIRNLVKTGVLPKSKGKGGLNIDACRIAYIHNLRHQATVTKVDEIDEGSMDFERYRLTKAQADAQELKNEIALGNVVPTEFAVFALTKVAAEAVGILDSLPMNINRKHPEITVLQTENIKREVAKACNVIAELDHILPGLVDEFITETTE